MSQSALTLFQSSDNFNSKVYFIHAIYVVSAQLNNRLLPFITKT